MKTKRTKTRPARNKKIVLSRETLKQLSSTELAQVVGGNANTATGCYNTEWC
jgi:bacteriocin-like protein